jgi:AmiR/NasT family two-component response regulator
MSEAKIRILVVEDESLVAMDLKRRLQRWGHEVLGPVATAEEALRIATAESPDLVLLDIRLQGEPDGTVVAKLLRERGDPAIVFLTANSDDDTLARAKASEPHAFLLKPFRDRDLQIALEMALYKSQAERRVRSLVAELTRALEHVKKLSGLLPICANCSKIRDDRGYWKRVETYIQEHSEATFSHSVCPTCAAKLYPEYFDAQGAPRALEAEDVVGPK